MQVKDLMVADVVAIEPHDDLRLVDEMMVRRGIRHIPVLEEGQVVGLITQRDLFNARMSSTQMLSENEQRAFLHRITAKEIMVHPVITISPDAPIREAVKLILTKGIGCLPVVQEGQLAGIITKTNLLYRLHVLSTDEATHPAHDRGEKRRERGLPNVIPY